MKGYVVINGLLSKSHRYGQEKLSYSIHQTPAPRAIHSVKEPLTFKTDLSWELEINEFFDAILKGRKIKIGNIYDALKLMILVDKIYKDTGINK